MIKVLDAMYTLSGGQYQTQESIRWPEMDWGTILILGEVIRGQSP
jgi:hypothetical protein